MTGRRRDRALRWGRAVATAVGAVASLALLAAAPTTSDPTAPDPYRPQQWNIERTGASSAWATGQGQGQVVAVLDSGVDLGHPDLADRFLRRDDGTILGRDIVDGDDVPEDPLGHGTMVAGVAVATADNGIGVAGVAPRARLLPVRVLDEEGRGTSRDVDRGIRWAVDNGATVINLSLESAASGDGDSVLGAVTVAAPARAVQYAWDNGVVVVAAAGNSGSGFTDYPASSPVVLVGATDRDDERSSFSDTGRDDLLMAPGVDIVSTWCRGPGDARCPDDTHSYGVADGTSFAAPHVAGAIAILRSAGLDHDVAVQRLRETARDLGPPGRDDDTGYGLIDLVAAVQPPADPSPTPTGAGTSTPTDATTAATVTPGPTAPEQPSVVTPAPEAPTAGTGSSTPSTSPSPDAETVSPAPAVTVPDVDASPVAVEDLDGPVDRAPWIVVALVLLALTGSAVGHSWNQAP